MYSASVLDMEVLFCFFDDKLTNLSPNSFILPDVLFLVSWQPAWSTSAKAVRAMQESFEYHKPIFMVPFSNTPMVEKIDKMVRLIIEGKVKLMDDECKPLKQVDCSGDHDSEDEVASTDNDMTNFLASKQDGYGNNSMLEQWKESYMNGNYDSDPYDDDMYEGQDIPDKIQDICDNFDITVRGRKKK
nr:hypothetical protein [Tanacetum cinerariifolium]